MAKTLLLADDSVTIQKVVSISFASEDVTLVTVDNGDDAVERARDTHPDLILADIVMPGKSGYEVCEAIKSDPDLRHIPVLLLTGTFEAFDAERAARVGAAGHVSKPFEAQALVKQVNRLLAQIPPPAPASEPTPEPARVAPSEAVTAPGPASSGDDDSFDFFEDDIDELGAAEPAARFDAVDLPDSDSDSAFAFGDEDLSPAAPAPAHAETAPPAAPWMDLDAAIDRAPDTDRTIAILPDDTRSHAAPPAVPSVREPIAAPTTAVTADLGDAGFDDPGDELLAVGDSDSDDFFASVDPSAASDEAFDFAFESESTAPESVPVATETRDDRISLGPVDVAEATVLDPTGASGYDVSSADLGDPFAADPFDVEIPTGEVPTGEIETLEVERAATGTATAEAADATRLMDVDARLHQTLHAAEIADIADAGEESLEPAHFASEKEPEAPRPRFEPPRAVAPPADSARPLPGESAARADSVLAEIAPGVRDSIHDTLEKIAWESFGDVTEKIVAEIVDRVEKIAWEVIPQLTETLVKEEIRRMKGEIDT